MDLDAELVLRTAGEYSHVGTDPANDRESSELAVLPEVYGNYLSAEVGPATSVDVMTPAVLIDQLRLVYCVNALRTASAPPVVIWNGKIQDPTAYTWNPADNYEGRGIIATLTFRLNVVTSGTVAVRHGGAVDGAGLPITNPIMGIFDVLQRRAGWTMADFDLGPSYITRRDMDALGYPFYWCFAEQGRTIRDWLLELMPHYHTDVTETGNGQLAMILDRSLTPFTVQPDYHIPAYEIEDQGRPATALTFTAHADDVANQVTLNSRYNWVTGDYTADYTWDYVQSQSAYQAVYPMPFSFRGMYTLAHATQWLQSFVMRHGFEPRTVNFTLKGLKGIPLITPRFVTVEWPPYGWVQHLLKIRKTHVSFGGRAVRLECIDCQRELSDVITSPTASPTQRRQQLSRLYTYVPGTVGDVGSLADAPTNVRNEATNGDFSRGNDGSWGLAGRWTIERDADLAYQGEWFAQHVPGMGSGDMRTLRQRIDAGEWVLGSAWFAATGGSNGSAHSSVIFSDLNDQEFLAQIGNLVPASAAYLESVLMVQAPVGAYYYKPGIDFGTYPTSGQWRCGKVFAISGSQQQVLSSRAGLPSNRNLIANGEFELGNVMFAGESGWDVSNNPAFPPYAGQWYAAHNPVGFAGESRLYSQTTVPIVGGNVLSSSLYIKTTGGPEGQVHWGVTWVDPQGNFMSPESSGGLSPASSFTAWTFAAGSMTAPAGAANARMWIGILGHAVTGLWQFDNWLVTVTA